MIPSKVMGAMFDNKLSQLKTDGVSPVIGVILMVAITVILAAVIGTFVLGLADDLDQDAQAAVTFDQEEGTSVTVQVNSVQSADDLDVRVSDDGSGSSATYDLGASAGDSVSLANASGSEADNLDGNYADDATLSVIGTLDGNSTVVQTYETA